MKLLANVLTELLLNNGKIHFKGLGMGRNNLFDALHTSVKAMNLCIQNIQKRLLPKN